MIGGVFIPIITLAMMVFVFFVSRNIMVNLFTISVKLLPPEDKPKTLRSNLIKENAVEEVFKKKRPTLEDRKNLALKEIKELSIQRGLYELDPEFCINNPSFLDNNAEHMIALSRAQKKAKRASDRITYVPLYELTEDDVQMMEEAADDLSLALESAVETSKAIGWGKISVEEKNMLSLAKTLLSKAMNEASSDNERMICLKKLEETIVEVREKYGYTINVEKIMLAVEDKTKMMITG